MSKQFDEYDSSGRRPPRKKTWLAVIIIVIAALVIASVAYWLAHSQAPAQGGGRFGAGGRSGAPGGLPMPVATATVAKGDINIVLNALGTVTPLRNVTVTAQVVGQLLSVDFKEGQAVNKGDLLAEIDPRSYQAALTQAEGALVRDEALLAEARIDLDRYQTLFKQDSIAKQQLDSQQSLVHQYEGTVRVDQGQIDNAKINLAYTRIVAPVTGRVGLRQVDPGNNLQASGSSIVVITQLKPIDVLFTLPEDNLPSVLKKMHAGDKLSTDAYDRSGQNKLASGSLASLDNLISTTTGTVNAKAEFGNDDESLFPNQFVNIRLLLDVMHDATIIPTSALERGSGGLFVYVVQPDKTVTVRNIKTGPTEGERVAVTDGLQVGDVVVTSGADRLRDGSKVELPGDAPPPSANAQKPAASGNGQGQHGQGQGHHRDAANPPAGNPANPNPSGGSAAPPANPSSPPAGADGKPANGGNRQ
ncbi:MAG: MdtA/MuxA family multidrug efflux RND transporter periplasmic adaptor subunit [Rudaea sp.]|nr:MdtA/MuxA family multidrug efflux RND transporter periplasmic adaptor subunit [Rudaea sp.]